MMNFSNNQENLKNSLFGDAVNQPIARHSAAYIDRSLDLYPWALSPSLTQLANQLGIPVSSAAVRQHSHPFHKTVETYLIHEHWSALATRPSSVMFMKEHKFEALQARNPNFVRLHNYNMEPKDATRYATLSSELPSTQNLFMHDALMHITPAQILDLFERCPHLDNLYASLIVPPEASIGLKSFYPEVYDFTVLGDRLLYFLEGNPSAGYDQPLSADFWLKHHELRSDKVTLQIVLLESWLSVHSLLIVRSNRPCKRNRNVFRTPELSLLPQARNVSLPLHARIVPYGVYDNLLSYVKAVRTLRDSDPHARIKNVREKAEHRWVHSAAWEHLIRFALASHKLNPPAEFAMHSSIIDFLSHTIKNKFLESMPSWKAIGCFCLSAKWLAKFSGRRVVYPVAFLLPALKIYQEYLKFTAPQFTSDEYIDYYHESRYTLHFDLVSTYLPSEPFLHLPLISPPKPSTAPVFDSTDPLNATKAIDPTLTQLSEQSIEVDDVPCSNIAPPNDLVNFTNLYPQFSCDEEMLLFTRYPEIEKPTIPSQNTCLFQALADLTCHTPAQLFDRLAEYVHAEQLVGPEQLQFGWATEHLQALAWIMKWRVTVVTDRGHRQTHGPTDGLLLTIYHLSNPAHWQAHPPSQIVRLSGKGVSPFANMAINFRCDGNLLPFLKVHRYVTSPHRAQNLATNLKNGHDGIYTHQQRLREFTADVLRRIDGVSILSPPRSIEMIHLSGFAGVGKSYPTRQFILSHAKVRQNFRVVTPTVDLRNEWLRELALPPSEKWRVSTWETALTKFAKILVVDEIYKLPNGYLDLILLLDPNISFVILLGDPCQGDYHSLNPASTNSQLRSEIYHLQPYRDIYCMYSYRIPKNVARFFGVRTYSNKEGVSYTSRRIASELPVVTPTRNLRDALAADNHQAHTYSSSQGLTFDAPCQINVDRYVSAVSPSSTLVALTRSRSGIILTGAYDELAATSCGNTMLHSFYSNVPIDFRSVFQKQLGNSIIVDAPITSRSNLKLSGGAVYSNLTNKQLKVASLDHCSSTVELKNDGRHPYSIHSFDHVPPSKMTHLSLFEPSSCSVIDSASSDPLETPCEPAYYGFPYETAMAQLLPSEDYDSKEIYFRGVRSNQFPTRELPGEYFGPVDPHLVAPIHNAKHDPTLLPASIPKRLRFRASQSAYQPTPEDHFIANFFFQSYSKMFARDPLQRIPFEPELFAQCISANDFAQLSKKSQAAIMANASRSDADWRLNFVEIFTKTQHKINSNNLVSGWKACQTLALMHDAIVLVFGPIKKYQRIINARTLKPNFFIFGGKTPVDLSNYVKGRFTTAPSVANDYTAFDQSQGGEALLFELLKMRHLSIPEEFIDLHSHIKRSLSCQFGPLTCMRFTGEPGTYDDNTDYNAAVILSQYDIRNETVLLSGDDSVVHPVPAPNARWHEISDLLKLKFKIELTRYPLFCSYYLGPAGAIRAPLPMLHKIHCALHADDLPLKLPSYIAEFAIGHSLGDAFWTLLPDFEHDAQAALFDFFCRRASKQLKMLLKIGPLSPQHKALLEDLSVSTYKELTQHQRIQILHGRARNPIREQQNQILF
ncbi:hypothetical protein [Hubei macula-like virus 1]|uniref:hypothetical protein n=1 Tax=Hubei macula-like virus 1 TaxID=1922922 RepID=UPI00090C96C4|nr:hypothetical protein [Hubei macula-like virus 1]APG77674.1 hypothetical protein [Hubei macula-like virus 1]